MAIGNSPDPVKEAADRVTASNDEEGIYIALPLGGVGIGIQRESRTVVAQRIGGGFHVHTVLQGQRGERVTQIVKVENTFGNLLDAVPAPYAKMLHIKLAGRSMGCPSSTLS